MKKKQLYRKFCAGEPSIPIFSRDWWLDVVAGKDNWDVSLVVKGMHVQAAMPYVTNKRVGFTLLGMPPLTQTLGPWTRESNAKYAKRLGQQKDLLQELVTQLPHFDHFVQNWHYTRTNWLPFYWLGFSQTTRYTYVLPVLSNEQALWKGLDQKIRTDIRKAKERYHLMVRTDVSVDDFFPLNDMVFKRQGKKVPYSRELVKQLDEACNAHNAKKIFIAEDGEGRHHAGCYLVWDENSAYYLLGGGDPALRNSGATSLCMWEAIKFAATVTRKFDFEGSMIEAVERFFRAFGAKQIPYTTVSKTPSRLLHLRKALTHFNKQP